MAKSIATQSSRTSNRPDASTNTRIVPKALAYDSSKENPHTWGFFDTQYVLGKDGKLEITGKRYTTSGQILPFVLPWFENHMSIKFPKEQRMPTRATPADLPAVVHNEAFLDTIRTALNEDQIVFDPLERLRCSHGHSLQDMCEVNYGSSIGRIPDVVLNPDSAEQVQAIVQAARKSNVCLLPFGGGTNVSRALACLPNEQRTIAAVSTRRLNRVLWIDRTNQQACIEAGAVGRHIVATLAEHGLTLGHEPDSIEFSTLGGWIATKASGMKKNKYGNIEDIVLDVQMVTLDGVFARAVDATPPRESVGTDMRASVFGSEGSMGIVTSAIVKVFPLPKLQQYGSILFPSFDTGYAFINDLARSGDALPASVRLVDNTQFQFSMALKLPSVGLRAFKSRLEKAYVTKIRGFDPHDMVACTLVFEGTASQVRAQQKVVQKHMSRHRGMNAGGANGQRGYEMTFAIAYIRDFAMTLGVLAESFETSCTWSAAPELIRRVKQRCRDEHAVRNLPGTPFISSRISQVYHTGVCIYFYLAIFAGHRDIKDVARIYSALEEAARDEILLCGGSLSHHHGIGTLRHEFLPRVLSPAAQAYHDRIKGSQDPDSIFPGGLAGAAPAEGLH
ncbi:Alkyldihydroxyacetonephosphate synthase, peroxisomal [Paramyrothecium foliicola]|nr:Alkyldihydroxyacetonephosphate synthase, peroxisomal [Paramyrothecium foliicola]